MSHHFKWCFPCHSAQLKTKIRDLLVLIAFTTEEYYPKSPELRRLIEEKRDAESSCSQSVLFFNCDINPALLLLPHRYEKITLDEVEKKFFFSARNEQANVEPVAEEEECSTTAALLPEVSFYIMSSQWKIGEVDRVISLCAGGNKQYQKLLKRQLELLESTTTSSPEATTSNESLVDLSLDDDDEAAVSSPCTTSSSVPYPLPRRGSTPSPKKIKRKSAVGRKVTSNSSSSSSSTIEQVVDRGIYSLSEEECHRLAHQATAVRRGYELKAFSTASKANRGDFDEAHVQEIIQMIDQTFGDGKNGLWMDDGKPLGYFDDGGTWNPSFNYILEMNTDDGNKFAALCTLAWHVDKGYWILENLCVSSRCQGYGPVFMNLIVAWLKVSQQPVAVWVDISKDNVHCCGMFTNLVIDGRKWAEVSKKNRLALSWEEQVSADTYTCFIYPEEFVTENLQKKQRSQK